MCGCAGKTTIAVVNVDLVPLDVQIGLQGHGYQWSETLAPGEIGRIELRASQDSVVLTRVSKSTDTHIEVAGGYIGAGMLNDTFMLITVTGKHIDVQTRAD